MDCGHRREENGLEHLVKLHSFDATPAWIDRPCDASYRHLRTLFRLDLRPHSSDDGRGRPADYGNGVAVPSGGGASLLRAADQIARLDASTKDLPAAGDRGLRPGVDHLSESACAGVHTGRSPGVPFLYLSGMGRVTRGGA